LLGWAQSGITHLISLVHLRELNLNNTGPYQSHIQHEHVLLDSEDLIAAVIKTHENSLETLGLLRVNIEDETLAAICSGLPRLRKFFFTQSVSSAMVRSYAMHRVVSDRSRQDIRSFPVSRLRCLEYLHISFMSDDSKPFPGIPNEADVVNLVEQCSPDLRQCGFNTRVWRVSHILLDSATGTDLP
jgi:hypothetical protein